MADEIRGLKEFKVNIEKMLKASPDKVETALKAGALIVQNDAKERAPFRTGNLRRSIHHETTEKSEDRVAVSIGTNVMYAPFQEFGTSRMPAHPFLRPALDENHGAINKEVADALKDLFGEAL